MQIVPRRELFHYKTWVIYTYLLHEKYPYCHRVFVFKPCRTTVSKLILKFVFVYRSPGSCDKTVYYYRTSTCENTVIFSYSDCQTWCLLQHMKQYTYLFCEIQNWYGFILSHSNAYFIIVHEKKKKINVKFLNIKTITQISIKVYY